MRGVDPAERWLISTMTLFNVKSGLTVDCFTPPLVMRTAFINPSAKVTAKGLQLFRANGILNNDLTVGVEEIDLFLCQHFLPAMKSNERGCQPHVREAVINPFTLCKPRLTRQTELHAMD